MVYGTGYIHKARIVFQNTIVEFIEETTNNANGGRVAIFILYCVTKNFKPLTELTYLIPMASFQ